MAGGLRQEGSGAPALVLIVVGLGLVLRTRRAASAPAHPGPKPPEKSWASVWVESARPAPAAASPAGGGSWGRRPTLRHRRGSRGLGCVEPAGRLAASLL